MAKDETSIVLVTQTKIIVPPTEKIKPVPVRQEAPRVAKPRPAPRKVEAKKVEVPKPKKTVKPEKSVKVSKAPVTKPSPEPTSGMAAKNQEAVKAGRVPNRLDVEPGRYDMLLS